MDVRAQSKPGAAKSAPRQRAIRRTILALQQMVATGMAPQELAGHVFDAIRNEQFYILPHPDWKALIEQRMQNILQGRTPS